MSVVLHNFNYCPGTLAPGFNTYSRTALKRVFNGKLINPILSFKSPANDETLYIENRDHLSLSGVQEKFSVLLSGNQIRLTREGERGTHILKPPPAGLKRADQMPANEHLTMQIARQVYGIETAENALIFFHDGVQAYITKRFDVRPDGSKWGQDDFASLSGKTPQTHGSYYKYSGSYLDLFEQMKKHLPSCKTEAPKLFRLIVFNYLFSNGDAHLKNFSILETPLGDYRLSPAYDLLNTHIHINDKPFALEHGLMPQRLGEGKIKYRFERLAELAGIVPPVYGKIIDDMLTKSDAVLRLIEASFLDASTKKSYWQQYQARLKRLQAG